MIAGSMVAQESEIRLRTPQQRERERTDPWRPGSGLARAVLVCVWLAALASCDAVKSEQNTREYVHEMTAELCAPDGFYLQCWWYFSDLCHEEMPLYVANAMPTAGKRIQTSETLRQHVLERVFFLPHRLVEHHDEPGIRERGVHGRDALEECPTEQGGDHGQASCEQG